MSDFTSEFWNWYIILISLVSIIGCGIFLWMQSIHKPKSGAAETMSHIWDENLQEYNNPMPKWWMWLFYITIVFSLVYLALYPGLGRFPGVLGWTSAKQHADEVAAMDSKVGPTFDRYLKTDIKALAADKTAMETGQRLFLTYCMQCHGANAKGSKGFPDLTDTHWQYGGEPNQIKESIMEGRTGMMTPHPDLATAESRQKLDDLVSFVRSLSKSDVDPAAAARGKAIYAEMDCVTCHGPEAKGALSLGPDYAALGAPDLTAGVWLYGGTTEAIRNQIVNGSQNQMPSWKDFLGESKVHLLAAYVYSLSNKK
ncbi:MAG: cytochrome-c oxidase, cbb3-type subunit III [Betaproteobacteria bacterium]|nr:cytochrome-c oxidase, cbb3-type subunit III [Betaproteobacteria bacterium]